MMCLNLKSMKFKFQFLRIQNHTHQRTTITLFYQTQSVSKPHQKVIIVVKEDLRNYNRKDVMTITRTIVKELGLCI